MAGQTPNETSNLKQPDPHPAPPREESERERQIAEAVERVYRRYGADFGALQRDLETELIKRT